MADGLRLQKELLTDFECLVCTEYMHPPINQCTTGHSFCNRCFDRVRKCPQCRAPKSTSRCSMLERIHSRLFFPCKYHELGCTSLLSGDQIKEHQLYCFSQKHKCPMHLNDVCKWEGSGTQILSHCLENHKNCIYFEPRRRFNSPGFGVNRVNRFVNSVFVVFGVLFRATWDLDIMSGIVRYGIYYMGKPVGNKRFSYRVSFLRGRTNGEAFAMKAPCLYLDNANLRFIGANFNLIANYDLLRKFCDENGDLRYVIQIFDNNSFKSSLAAFVNRC